MIGRGHGIARGNAQLRVWLPRGQTVAARPLSDFVIKLDMEKSTISSCRNVTVTRLKVTRSKRGTQALLQSIAYPPSITFPLWRTTPILVLNVAFCRLKVCWRCRSQRIRDSQLKQFTERTAVGQWRGEHLVGRVQGYVCFYLWQHGHSECSIRPGHIFARTVRGMPGCDRIVSCGSCCFTTSLYIYGIQPSDFFINLEGPCGD